MLDTDTKRRIDTARDILVGKVPDPKSQVEQITIGLIYKFREEDSGHPGPRMGGGVRMKDEGRIMNDEEDSRPTRLRAPISSFSFHHSTLRFGERMNYE